MTMIFICVLFSTCTRATDIFVKVVDAMEEDSASIKQVPCR